MPGERVAGVVLAAKIVKRHRGEAIELAWPSEALTDLDEPADLERVRARLEAA